MMNGDNFDILNAHKASSLSTTTNSISISAIFQTTHKLCTQLLVTALDWLIWNLHLASLAPHLNGCLELLCKCSTNHYWLIVFSLFFARSPCEWSLFIFVRKDLSSIQHVHFSAKNGITIWSGLIIHLLSNWYDDRFCFWSLQTRLSIRSKSIFCKFFLAWMKILWF